MATYLVSMRTTAMSDSDLLATAKPGGRRRGVAVGHGTDRPTVPVFTGGTGSRPDLDLTSNRALYEALDEGQELDRLR
jgi:hypothetical protein